MQSGDRVSEIDIDTTTGMASSAQRLDPVKSLLGRTNSISNLKALVSWYGLCLGNRAIFVAGLLRGIREARMRAPP